MIVVIMRKKHEIDFWKIRKVYSWSGISFWSKPLDWTCTFRPNRISKDIESTSLYQNSRMSYICDDSTFIVMNFDRFYWMYFSFFPKRNPLVEDPSKKCKKSVLSFFSEKFFFCFCKTKCFSGIPPNIIEFFPIKMIAFFTFVTFARELMIHKKYYTESDKANYKK